MSTSKTFRDREILSDAQSRGGMATLGAYFRLSGPGWLQSAITLGGGSLGGALYLGMLAGVSMLWLQWVAIAIGVIMLSAISYVTLSTGKRPYAAINNHVNPVLGVGWITATVLANMIWIMPQFSLCFDSLDTCLGQVQESNATRIVVSAIIAVVALAIVTLSFNPGWMVRLFDIFLKLTVGFVVICFVLAAVKLFQSGHVNWANVFWGMIPNWHHWYEPAPELQALGQTLDESTREFWYSKIVGEQRNTMIGVTATAVGLNMTFLLPYSMLARGWDRTFRGLARFDLITGMAIPYLIVTTCIVIASAYAFHAKADPLLLADDPAAVQSSPFFKGIKSSLEQRYLETLTEDQLAAYESLAAEEQTMRLAEFAASLPVEERQLAAAIVKPSAGQLAATLSDLLGETSSRWVFGLGAFAMGFSTIIILMVINGYAVAEIAGDFENNAWRIVGASAAVIVGFFWWQIWQDGMSKTWLIIMASTFGAILLPIAYLAFFALMNSASLLGDDMPRGKTRWIVNILMGIGVGGAVLQAVGAISTKVNEPVTGPFVIGGVVTFLLLVIVGFSVPFQKDENVV